jgi:hypothetical protein
MAYVYKHIRKDTNEVFYIGIGKTKRRLTNRHGRNDRWTKLVNKVGFVAEIIEDGLDWDAACEMEKKLIKQYGRADLGEGKLVNMTDGGDGINNYSHSDETKKKMSNRMGRSMKGELNPQFGKPLSEEHKLKISLSKSGRKQSEEHIKNRLESYNKTKFGKLV